MNDPLVLFQNFYNAFEIRWERELLVTFACFKKDQRTSDLRCQIEFDKDN